MSKTGHSGPGRPSKRRSGVSIAERGQSAFCTGGANARPMRSRSLALVALLVVAAAGAAATPVADAPSRATVAGDDPSPPLAAAPVQTSVPNTTNYLALPADGVETARIDSARLDVASTLSLGSSDLRGQYNATRFAVRLERADSEERVLRRTVVDLRDQVASLRARQQAAVEAYNRGALTTEAFLREIAVVHTRADAAGQLASEVVSRTNSPLVPRELLLEARYVRAELDALTGPVRARAADALTGERDPLRVYVSTAAEGVVLATVDSGLYVREAYVEANRATGGDAVTGTGQAYDIVTAERYPWAGENVAGGGVDGFPGGAEGQSLYRVTVPHTQGTLVAHLDGQSGEVFREVQTKRLAAAPTRDAIVNSTDGAVLTLGRTHAGGQLVVSLSDPATGEGLSDVPVSVGGKQVGTTGEDGVLYALQPRDSVQVLARTDGGNVTAAT